MIEITRFPETFVFTAGSSAATTSPRFSFRHHAGGALIIASTNGATQITWRAAAGPEDTPVIVYADGAAVTTAVTVGAHPIPDACFAFPYLAPVISGSSSCSMTVVAKG